MKFEPQNNDHKIKSHRRENYFKESFTLFEIKNGQAQEVADLRHYSSKDVETAVIWINYKYAGGISNATGVGKNQYYAIDACREAIENAGFTGTTAGQGAERNMKEVAQILNLSNYFIHHAHS